VLAVAGAGTVAGAKILINRYTSDIKQEKLLGDSGVQRQHTNLMTVQGPINILLVGVDARGTPGETVRADSIIILHVPANHDRAYLVSLPRDADVQIPAYTPTHFAGARAKINSAFAFGSQDGHGWGGGFQLLAATITKLTGIHFNAGAIVNFDGFRAVVNALGGVRMCVDEKVVSIHHGKDSNGKFAKPYTETPSGGLIRNDGVTPDTYYPGCQQMTGWQALDYVRQRKLIPDGDYGRERHQQQFLKAMMDKATGNGLLSNPGRLDAVIRAAGAALTVDNGGVPFQDWAYTLRNLRASNVVLVKTNGGQFQSFWVGGELRERLIPDSIEMLQSIRTDQLEAFLAGHPTWRDSTVAPTRAHPG
jgi:LCP family protein required for cell wall assembly